MELIETCFLTSVIIYHKCVTLGGSTEHFITIGGFRGKCLAACAKYSVQVTMHFGKLGIHALTIRMLG